ncbi:hypothetical protein [Paracoccus aerodenitrificans]|uniref:hypothetical protein n=1 Tax=Paracoccus aerodenitrificans TaxID=3017781 RepID=UPI0022F06BBB|nr:hypothetical protein [Paracoccus aerodenitrificans]WBU65231.1 hypothetical protein PAE61_07340 [Paracoccus aerodenitrificans]
MISKLKTSVASLALIAAFGTGLAFAQTEAQPQVQPAPAENAAPGGSETQLPAILQGEGFTDVETRPGRRGGAFAKGTIAESGKDFQAMIGPDGQLVAIRTAEGSSLPQSLVDEMLSQAARDNAVTAEITELNAIGTRGDAVMISGQDASGDTVRIEFGADGELVHFSRGEEKHDGDGPRGDMRKPMGPGGDMHDDKEREGDKEADHDHEDDDKADDHPERKDAPRGDRGERRPGGDPARMIQPSAPEGHQPMPMGERAAPEAGGAAQPGDAPQPVDEAALRSAVEEAGYTELGTIRPEGPGATVEAVNPQGEEVVVTVSPEGEVVRETAR